MNNRDGSGSGDDGIVIVIVLFLLIVGLPIIIWTAFHEKLSYWGLYFAWKQLSLLDWDFLPWAGHIRNDIAALASNPADVKFGELLWRMTQAGFLFGWLPVVVSVLTIRTSLRHRSEKIRRNITASTLPEIMSEHCKAVIPVLHYGDLMNEDIKGQESREHPAEFAKRHGLVNKAVLDEEKTADVFLSQLGNKITSLSELKIYEQALFAVFASRVFDTFENNGKAQKMLDMLNSSCATGTWKGQPGYPDFSVIRNEIRYYIKSPEAQELLTYFQYPSTYLHMLHLRAMKRGKLVSSNFRWLKGIDRSLWYVLNASGRKVPCIESLIQVQTYRTEHLAWTQGLKLIDPPVGPCIEAFSKVLIKEGVLPKPLVKTDNLKSN